MNKDIILQYLRYHGDVDKKTDALIDECIEEVKEYAYFKAVVQEFHVTHSPLKIEELDLLIESKDLEFYFKECSKCLIIACTLGIQVDRRIQYYEHIDMTKAVIFDAVSSCYLEECCEKYEASLKLGLHTFRFAPGYGDIPIELNKTFSRVLQIDRKLGVSLSESGLFIPMKTMLGMIGIGKEVKKTCLSCMRKDQCELRRGGSRCYVNI